jgi:hypothetical protein
LRVKTGVFGRAASVGPGRALPAQALWDDKLEIFAQENITYDSNVFRLSDNIDSAATCRQHPRSDTIYTTIGGFLLTSRSACTLPARLPLVRRALPALRRPRPHGHIARARGTGRSPTLTGDVSYNEWKGLASFANIQGRQPDLVDHAHRRRQRGLDDDLGLPPARRVHRRRDRAQRVRRSTTCGLRPEVGLSFVSARENRVGVAFRRSAAATRRSSSSSAPFDNEYEQTARHPGRG